MACRPTLIPLSRIILFDMTPNGDQDRRSFNKRGTVAECDLCGERRQCIDDDGMVACSACQSELLPSGWGL
ncbi:hypothetical protein KDQ40_10990 [Haloarcula marismortui ATCC 33800]|uniref:Uncharacterized protein n=2 Tax=Haloarcula marismortui TaxID=2238 RepID=A0A8T8KE83_9EURY|nr:hypothetical protein KDQ40_10990 [Haloarcula sinaiiensis ATCC 33800]